ncbi:MAG: hypothetical protein AAF487_07245 [Bacteroidota bacterium]
MKKKKLISIETLHLVAGFSLVLAGLIVIFNQGIEIAMSWIIFGAMYISMSDIGEKKMRSSEKKAKRFKLKFFFAFIGAIFSQFLLFYYLFEMIS